MNNTNDTITLAEGKAWTKAWRERNPNAECRAFLIPKKDLTGLLTEDIDAVRAYMAYGPNESGVKEDKLVIVGTKLDPKTGVQVDMLPDPTLAVGNGNNIYDFTTPCPPVCDPKSDLN